MNLLGMRQFYETFREQQFVAAVLRQFPVTHHLPVNGQWKRPEEREFFLLRDVTKGDDA